jgi:hypothetical protein
VSLHPVPEYAAMQLCRSRCSRSPQTHCSVTRIFCRDIKKLEEKIDEEKRRREELRDDDEIDQLYSTAPIERDLIQQERNLDGIRSRAKEHEDKVAECDRLFKEAEKRKDELVTRSDQDSDESLEIRFDAHLHPCSKS